MIHYVSMERVPGVPTTLCRTSDKTKVPEFDTFTSKEGDGDARFGSACTQALLRRRHEEREREQKRGHRKNGRNLYTEPPFAVLQRAYSSQETVQWRLWYLRTLTARRRSSEIRPLQPALRIALSTASSWSQPCSGATSGR